MSTLEIDDPDMPGAVQGVPPWVYRVFGGIQLIGGAALTPGTCGTSLLLAGTGVVVAGNGLDNVQAGLRMLIGDKEVKTVTQSAVADWSGSELLGAVVDIGIGFANPKTLIKLLGRACFTEGTQIVVGMEFDENDVFVQYVTANIEDVKTGDWVYSYDTVTGEVSQKQVTETYALESDHINYLTIIDEEGNEQVVETTDTHPFWVVTDEPDLDRAARELADGFYHENIGVAENGFWVEAKDLRSGDVFLGANGELSTLVDADRVVFPEGIKVYNFAVEGNHDYFVIAECGEYGQTSILVHNGSCTKHAQTLRANMEAAGKLCDKVNPDGTRWAAHHIVSSGDSRFAEVEESRRLLRKLLGNRSKADAFNNAANGVYLSSKLHKGLHTAKYHREVLERLQKATPDNVKDVLAKIASEIKNGTFPH